MTDTLSDTSDRARLFERAVSRWENEGGAVVEAGSSGPASAEGSSAASPGSAEFVQMQFRVIALENLMIALLARAPAEQQDLVRELAAYISPRPGFTHHPMTIRAADEMLSLLGRSGQFRSD